MIVCHDCSFWIIFLPITAIVDRKSDCHKEYAQTIVTLPITAIVDRKSDCHNVTLPITAIIDRKINFANEQ